MFGYVGIVIKEDFEVEYGGANAYYIWGWDPDYPLTGNEDEDHLRRSVYMHADGSIHDICGELNFFKTKKKAREILDRAFKPDEHITDKDLEISI